MTTATMDNPNVLIRPPRLFLGFILSGLMLDVLYPLTILQTSTFWLAGAGIALILVSVWLVRLSMGKFHQAETNVATWQPAKQIVSTGIYRFSRNPIYLSMFMGYEGLMLLLNNLWLLLLIIPLYATMHYGVILREERYLEEKFVQQYLDYKQRVRRWF